MDTVKIDSENTKLIAHRGLCGLELENTNASFVAAGQSIHNIVIENNVIKAANHPHGIFLRNVENAILRGNK